MNNQTDKSRKNEKKRTRERNQQKVWEKINEPDMKKMTKKKKEQKRTDTAKIKVLSEKQTFHIVGNLCQINTVTSGVV